MMKTQVKSVMLLVANAYIGWQARLSFQALCLRYLNLVPRDSLVRNVRLAILIVPNSFATNVIRVLVLSLITYHWGDAAGQGFLHGFAGVALFLCALLLIIGFDTAMQHLESYRQRGGRANVWTKQTSVFIKQASIAS